MRELWVRFSCELASWETQKPMGQREYGLSDVWFRRELTVLLPLLHTMA